MACDRSDVVERNPELVKACGGGVAAAYIYGGTAGSDTYRYKPGDGSDTINDESGSIRDIDVLHLVDLDFNEVTTVWRNAGTLFITDKATGSVITVQDQFSSTTQNCGIEEIAFADGTTWNLAETVQGWCDTSSNQIDKTQIADGYYMNASDVEALRSAMSSFVPPPVGQTALDAATAQALASSWHAA